MKSRVHPLGLRYLIMLGYGLECAYPLGYDISVCGLGIRMCISPGIVIIYYAGLGIRKYPQRRSTLPLGMGARRAPLVSDAALAASQPPAGYAHKTVLRDSYWADIAVDAVSVEYRTPTSIKCTSIVMYYTAVHTVPCKQKY